jgi:hypothetical protein
MSLFREITVRLISSLLGLSQGLDLCPDRGRPAVDLAGGPPSRSTIRGRWGPGH